ncbi:MAG TPA: hypothetical protein VKS00_01675 [Candidatus Acidoferrales bacterium]|nr:hypothetical protein [Candidatus Acidoferrales bacterium]
MQVATDAEVVKWLAENEWNHGIRADGTALYYADSGADCFELKFPETPLRITHFARVASMLGISEESLFYGALLWITLSTIGSPQLEKSGWKLVEKMRQGYGENRPLQTASGHFFRDDELVDLTAFLVPCFVYGWDAYVVPNARNDFFLRISHDEYWVVVARTKETYDKLFSKLKGLNPKESPGMRGRFCRPANT